MNWNYVLVKNEALVFDENRHMTIRANQEGLEAVLEQENIVEDIQKQIVSFEREIPKMNKWISPKYHIIPFILLNSTMMIMLVIAGLLLLGTLNDKALYIGPGLFFGSIDLLYIFADRMIVRSIKKSKNDYEAQLEYLKQREKEEIAKLEQMKQELTKQAIIESEKTVNKGVNSDNLRQLRSELTRICDENHKKPEQGKQKVLG